MASWSELEAAAPEIATGGRTLIYQFGVGLGYLATVRKDGGPRMHPFCPVIAEGELWGLIGPSPKRHDLLRDGRFAFHSFASPDKDDEFYLAGRAREVRDPAVRAAVLTAYLATGATSSGDELFFAFDLDRALLATYEARPSWPPVYRTWRAT